MFAAVVLALGFLPVAPAPDVDAVLVMDLRAVDIATSQAKLVDGLVASAVARRLKMLPTSAQPTLHTFEEFRTLADVEAQRSVSGCDDASASCLAEIAGALGARYVVSGTLGGLGDEVVLQLALLDTRTAQTLSRSSAGAASVSALRDRLDVAVADVLDPIVSAEVGVDDDGPSFALIAGGSVAAIGVVAAVAGFGGLAVFESRLTPTSTSSGAEKQQALELAWPALWVGVGGTVVAAAGVAVAMMGAQGE